MSTDRPAEYLVSLVRELCKLAQETEWVEFKVNDAEPQEIGENISALANSAALTGKAFGYLIWGVANINDWPGSGLAMQHAPPARWGENLAGYLFGRPQRIKGK